MNNLVEYLYAASVSFSQGLVTFSQIREEQKALAKMSDSQIKDIIEKKTQKIGIGFNRA